MSVKSLRLTLNFRVWMWLKYLADQESIPTTPEHYAEGLLLRGLEQDHRVNLEKTPW